MLNDICSTIYEKYKNYDTITLENIELELVNFDTYKFDKKTIVKSIYNFLSDYEHLMISDGEDYIFMPINYLLFEYGYDGIYNKNGDIASKGSVKYFFDGIYPARGYIATYKKREPMKGKLIFRFQN